MQRDKFLSTRKEFARCSADVDRSVLLLNRLGLIPCIVSYFLMMGAVLEPNLVCSL